MSRSNVEVWGHSAFLLCICVRCISLIYLECFNWGVVDNGGNIGAHDAGYMLRDEGMGVRIRIQSVERLTLVNSC